MAIKVNMDPPPDKNPFNLENYNGFFRTARESKYNLYLRLFGSIYQITDYLYTLEITSSKEFMDMGAYPVDVEINVNSNPTSPH